MENQQKKIFANCSQTIRSHCEFRNVFANQFRIAKSDTPVHCSFAKFFSHKTYAKFRIAKFTMSSQSQFRNAKTIRNAKISQSQFRNAKANFAMPKSNFAMPTHCSFVSTYAKFRIAKFTTHFANFANPFRIAKFTAFAKFTFAGLVILSN